MEVQGSSSEAEYALDDDGKRKRFDRLGLRDRLVYHCSSDVGVRAMDLGDASSCGAHHAVA